MFTRLWRLLTHIFQVLWEVPEDDLPPWANDDDEESLWEEEGLT